ncbi:MAG: beta-ketoacyl synthase, partial [Henriciella sp.]
MRLPIIVSMGGVNAAGRTSGFQSFRRMIIEALADTDRKRTIAGIAVMMGLVKTEDGERFSTAEESDLDLAGVVDRFENDVMEGTLVRRVEPSYFDVDALHWQSSAMLQTGVDDNAAPLEFVITRDRLPDPVPDNWSIEAHDDKHVRVRAAGGVDVKLNNTRDFPIKAAGQLPRGFDMSGLYNSRFQPRGLQ